MHYIVYKIKNLANDKIYIGVHQTEDLNDGYMGSGTILQKAIEKYGKEKFKKEILFELNSEDEMFLKEAELVNEKFVQRKDTYNLMTGGLGGRSVSLESRMKMSKVRSGENNYKWGKHLSEETKKKISENHADCSGENNSFYGKHHTEETKKKISESKSGKCTGKNNPMYGKNHTEETKIKMSENHVDVSGKNNPMYGKNHTKKSKEKISKNRIGKYTGKNSYWYNKHHTDESREKISKSHIGRKWMYNEELKQCTLVKDVIEYLNDGWKLGRKKFDKKEGNINYVNG